MQPSKWPDLHLPSYRQVKTNFGPPFGPARNRRGQPYRWPPNRQPSPMDEWYSTYLYQRPGCGYPRPRATRNGHYYWPPPPPQISAAHLSTADPTTQLAHPDELFNYVRLRAQNNPHDIPYLPAIDEDYILAAAALQSATSNRPLNIASQMHPAYAAPRPEYYLSAASSTASPEPGQNNPCVTNTHPTSSQSSLERPIRSIIPKTDTTNHFHIFVGDLSADVDTDTLRQAFQEFGEISDCRVVRDQYTHNSKGYGFVAFRCQTEANAALVAMNNRRLGDRAVRTRWAFRKPPAMRSERPAQLDFAAVFNAADANNRTVYCCASVSEPTVPAAAPALTKEKLTELFGTFGAIEEMRVFDDKAFAFIRFGSKEAAARAIVALHQTDWHGHRLKCAWSKGF